MVASPRLADGASATLAVCFLRWAGHGPIVIPTRLKQTLMSEETFRVEVIDPRSPEAAELIMHSPPMRADTTTWRTDLEASNRKTLSAQRGVRHRPHRGIPLLAAQPSLEEDVAELRESSSRLIFAGEALKAIVNELERQARARGYRVVRLETGVRQPEAISLYESLGYYPIPNYGEYRDSSLSVCFEKGRRSSISRKLTQGRQLLRHQPTPKGRHLHRGGGSLQMVQTRSPSSSRDRCLPQ